MERVEAIRTHEKKVKSLEERIKREIQFKKKIELNRQLREWKKAMEELQT